CREVAYITLSSFRVNPFFRIFLCNRTGCLCEVIHICRVSGAHYRELSENDKRKNTILFQPLIF
ncbi:hypothetical protein U4L66_05465, partial [Klebsiella pneumoniae]|nr:hypothetical protein [Klebsiella pneumoniae]